MTNLARSSAKQKNTNTLRVHKVKVFVQRFPGKFGTDEERTAGSDLEYSVYINGRFSQTGKLAADGSVDVYIPGGQKAELEVMGSKYEIEPVTKLEAHDSLKGIQRRLRLLGYYQQDIEEKWDGDFDRAVLNFQADHSLDPNGKAMEATTCNKIKSEFGE